MAIELKMPALSPTMEEGTLAKWLKSEGDEIVAGDIIAEIETDKATMEFEAVDEGTLGKIMVEEGTEGVKVGTVIAMLAGEGEDASDIEAPAASGGSPASSNPRASTRSRTSRARARISAGRKARPRSPSRSPRPTSATPMFPKAPATPRPASARLCATGWPRKCAATSAFS